MRVRAVQVTTDLTEPVAERVERVAGLVRAQRGADLVVLPELWAAGGFAFRTFAEVAEPLDGPTVQTLSAAAAAARTWLHGGSIVERADDGRLYNCSLLFRPDGSLAATYRKIHLFGFSGGETTVLTAGSDVVTADVDGLTVALATCYDVRFPELFRLFVDRGAELVLLPAAWPSRRVEHWRLLTRARAVEDQVYVVACGGAGEQDGVRLGGHSAVIDPWGVVLAEAGETEEVLEADLDLGLVARTRADFPVLPDRRL